MHKNDDFEDLDLEIAVVKPYAPPKPRNTETVEVNLGEGEQKAPLRVPPVDSFSKNAPREEKKQIITSRYSGRTTAFDKRSARPRESGKTVLEYDRAGTVHHVRIDSWGSGCSFYEKFAGDAVKSNAAKLPEDPVPHVPFFSYIPQYSSLHPTQWRYYLYFKKCVREGIVLPEADFSYILLYIYEILNLDGVLSPTSGADTLGSVWAMYRGRHTSLDKYLSEWMIDYCLVHDVPLPRSVSPFIHSAALHSLLREFYFDTALVSGSWKELAVMLVSCLSDYSPSRSRFGESVDNFTEKMYEKLVPVVKGMAESNIGIFKTEDFREVTVRRDAYCGSLCSSSVKKKLILSLHSPFRAVENRKLMTDIVKKCENIIRAEHGVRSRLSAPSVKEGSLAELFKALFGEERAVRKKSTSEDAEYMKYYDSPDIPLSAETAAEIEAESWKNTELLAEDFSLSCEDGSEYADCLPEGAVVFDGNGDTPSEHGETGVGTSALGAEDEIPPLQAGVSENADGGGAEAEDGSFSDTLKKKDEALYTALVNAALFSVGKGGKPFGDACRERSLFADRAAEKINELARDVVGDIILEGNGTSYEIIEDYIDEILPENGGLYE